MDRKDLIRELNGRYYESLRAPPLQLDLDLNPITEKHIHSEVAALTAIPHGLDFSSRNPPIEERFIPGIDPRYEETIFWKKAGLAHSFGYMSSYHMLKGAERATKAQEIFREGAKQSRLILSGVMPDNVQSWLNDEKHLEFAKTLDAYAVTTVEHSLYTDDPPFHSVPILYRYLDALRLYHQSGLNVYPYVIGATDFEFKACCFFLKEMGFRTVFYDASGLVQCRRWQKLVNRVHNLQRQFPQVAVSNFCSFRQRLSGVSFLTPIWYKVPRATGCLVAGTVATRNEISRQNQLSKEELLYRSFVNIKLSFDDMTEQKLLTDCDTELMVKQTVVNKNGKGR